MNNCALRTTYLPQGNKNHSEIHSWKRSLILILSKLLKSCHHKKIMKICIAVSRALWSERPCVEFRFSTLLAT